jgi:hypothetical protein
MSDPDSPAVEEHVNASVLLLFLGNHVTDTAGGTSETLKFVSRKKKVGTPPRPTIGFYNPFNRTVYSITITGMSV